MRIWLIREVMKRDERKRPETELKGPDLLLVEAGPRTAKPAPTRPKSLNDSGTASGTSLAHGDISHEESILPFQSFQPFPCPRFFPPWHFALDETITPPLSWNHDLGPAQLLRLLLLLRLSLDGPWMETYARLRQQKLKRLRHPDGPWNSTGLFLFPSFPISPRSHHDHHHPPRHLRRRARSHP